MFMIKSCDSAGKETYFYCERDLDSPLNLDPHGLDLSFPHAVFGEDPKRAKVFERKETALKTMVRHFDGSKNLKIERKM